MSFAKKDTGRLSDGSKASINPSDSRLSRRNTSSDVSIRRNSSVRSPSIGSSTDRHDINLLRPSSWTRSEENDDQERLRMYTADTINEFNSRSGSPVGTRFDTLSRRNAQNALKVPPYSEVTPYVTRRGLPDRPLSPSRYHVESPRHIHSNAANQGHNNRGRGQFDSASSSSPISSIWFWAAMVVVFNLLLLGGFFLSFPDQSVSNQNYNSHDSLFDTAAARSFLMEGDHEAGYPGQASNSSNSSRHQQIQSSAGVIRPFPSLMWREVDTLLNEASSSMGSLAARFGVGENSALVAIHSALGYLTKVRSDIISLQTIAQVHAAQAVVLSSSEKELLHDLSQWKDSSEASTESSGNGTSEAEAEFEVRYSQCAAALAEVTEKKETCEVKLRVATVQLEQAQSTDTGAAALPPTLETCGDICSSSPQSQALREKLTVCQTTSDQIQKDLSSTTANHKSATAQLTKAEARVGELTTSLTAAENSLADSKHALSQNSQQLSRCQGDLDAAKEAAASAADLASSGQGCNDTVAKQQQKISELLSSHAVAVSDCNAVRATLQDTVEAAEARATKTTQALQSCESKLQSEENKVSSCEQSAAVCTASLESSKKSLTDMDSTMDDISAKHQRSLNQITSLNGRFADLETKLKQEVSVNATLLTQIQDLKRENEACEDQINHLKLHAEEVQAKCASTSTSTSTSDSQDTTTTSHDETLRAELEACISAKNELSAANTQLTDRLDGAKTAHEILFSQVSKEILSQCKQTCQDDLDHHMLHHHHQDLYHDSSHDHDKDFDDCISKCVAEDNKRVSAHNLATAKLSSADFNPVTIEVIPSNEVLQLRAENLEVEVDSLRSSLDACRSKQGEGKGEGVVSSNDNMDKEREIARLLSTLKQNLAGDDDGWKSVCSKVDSLTKDVSMVASAVSDARSVLQAHAEKARVMSRFDKLESADPLARLVAILSGPAASSGPAVAWAVRGSILFLIVVADLIIVQLLLPPSRFLTFLVVIGWAATAIYSIINKFWTLNSLCIANTLITAIIMIAPSLAMQGSMKNNVVSLG